ncbi:Predicted protein [Taphrina deformans PYCC 5710]|uniref:GST N-terminal domain-containing protein n=1 Tax=Taphrina deformans (strain PYCC 5710 / ATCC 11124 / CBS 356.35 / IMI 108563 / JCM 9778 / NBRC 8474) TaxID=1097556 RepID=R4X9J7_TAPDE|nr:Predicted protein [Taphrina deformans PYCC 5710]|eukprot:CCG82080.1 Predicted protein [Taphrina deformans PYCC 5710]
MSATGQACPVTGSKVTALPPDHPDTRNSDKPCPVTNATVDHHRDVVREHPVVSSSATAKDCPVLSQAEQDQVCPVVGTSVTALPPSHPTTTNGDVCPVTKAKSSDHKGLVHAHPDISASATAKDCPVLSSTTNQTTTSAVFATTTPKGTTAGALVEKCPITGSQVTTLPPDHPPTTDGEVCPVTKATLTHHNGVVREHPPVAANATAKDCPVLQKAEEAKVCPVVGTTATVLPPNHPTAVDGQACPVTGAKAEHHNNLNPHPSVSQANGNAKCPVTGAVAEHHTSVDPGVANATVAQCPVTGQFADGSRPEVQLPEELAAEPIKYTLMGIPFSTYTRTVAMGLHELKIPFTQVPVPPHSEEILEYNPFGRLPVLLLEHSGKTMSMFETDSIVRYLDSADDRILRFPAKDMVTNQKVEEWIGIITNYVFPAVEQGVVKPHLSDKTANLQTRDKSLRPNSYCTIDTKN